MNHSNDKKNETQIPIESEFNKLNVSDKISNPSNNHKKCYRPKYKKLWCRECAPCCIIEGWTSDNKYIDKFIKETIYNAKYFVYEYDNDDSSDDSLYDSDDHDDYINRYNKDYYHLLFLEWVPFDKFEGIKQIGEGGFSKIYSATWIDGKAKYKRQDDGSWKKKESSPMKIALKKLNDSQNISVEYLNKLKTYWNLQRKDSKYYGITKDSETKEFMMIIEFSERGSLRSILSNDFSNILWKDKINCLFKLSSNLQKLHKLEYIHKNFHSGNVLYNEDKVIYISDFGLLGPSYRQKVDDEVCGVLPYIAPEVLNGEPYTFSSDIYSFGVIMTELSSGKPPFYKRKHDINLALEICNGLRPEFGKGTPEIYKKLAHRCMNAIPNQRPTATELTKILDYWHDSLHVKTYDKFGYKGEEIMTMFEKADKEIPNILTSYETNPDAIYTSRVFTFNNLSKPINSPVITSYLNDEGGNEGGFAKVYSAIWIDGKTKYERQYDGSWEKREPEPIKVALKKLNESQNISAEYLNELKIHWKYNNREANDFLKFYGITKDPETNELIMIIEFSEKGNLRNFLLNEFNNTLWKDKILPAFGKGTPEIYKKLAYRCMNAIPDQRPTAKELYYVMRSWINNDEETKEISYKEEVKVIFEEADKEIPNISISYEKNPDAIYTSRLFTFSNLSKPINSPIITSYLNEEEEDKECQDSQIIDLEVPSSEDECDENNA
ncbi:kinase-like domain-containing protein [Rhizophagus irregularis DAOM 181602=DAOM 197198]|nr:kinase-like domain-containing protein [Rhizophagus irregularis DAOM 181602=DAOM 197198]